MDRRCLNCSQMIPDTDSYCGVCGQGVAEQHLGFWDLVKDGTSIFFNYDSRFWHTLKDLYKPDELTKAFVEGRRRKYVNPIRTFVVLVFVVGLAYVWQGSELNFDLENTLQRNVERVKIYSEADTLIQNILGANVNPGLKDSILCARYPDYDKDIQERYFMFSAFGRDYASYNINLQDAVDMDIEGLLNKYNVVNWWDRVVLHMAIKLERDPKGSIYNLVANAVWVLILQCLLGAIVMKLFFFNKNYYFMEHVVFGFYGHSTMLFAILIYKVTIGIVGSSMLWIGVPLTMVLAGLQWSSMKRYYRLSVLGATFLQSIYLMGYMLGLMLSLLLVWSISLLTN